MVRNVMPLKCFAYVIFSLFLINTNGEFRVLWNVPSLMCTRKFGVNMTDTLLKYNILVNEGEKFIGDEIALIYESQIGNYPHIGENKTYLNGGLPLMDKLTEHLQKANGDIQKIIPNSNFRGLGIIDWEAWRPIWEYHWGKLDIYKKAEIELVKLRHPKLCETNNVLKSCDKFIEQYAKNTWENAAKQWMLQTLELAKKLRPEGRWCYYLFPDCYNYFGKDQPSQFFCSAMIKANNDRLSWMWDASTALCPSIYFIENQMKYNDSQRTWFLYGKLAEAVRVSKPHTRIYPYINFMIHTSQVPVPQEHFWKMLSLIASFGLDGAIIWGSSNYLKTKKDCEKLEDYIENVIGPAVTTVRSNVEQCSRTICGGKGKCTWPGEPFTSWKYFTDANTNVFDAEKITCRYTL